ncbi:MAG: DNA mismatch repair protein [Flavobacterium sp.]|nr:DNA mismatch repair protein [Flavobacterium sp.]
MEIYQSRLFLSENELLIIKKNYNTISIFRLIATLFFLIFGYYFFKTESTFYIYLSLVSLAIFLLLMRVHNKIDHQKKLKEALIEINQNEISFLNREKIPFDNGIEFNDFQHTYAYDLDIFGENSLFQNLNRTFTYIGKKTLSNALLSKFSNNEILENQESIEELSHKIDFRQDFMSISKISKDNKSNYDNLLLWIQFNNKPLSKLAQILSFLLPIVFAVLVLLYVITKNELFFTCSSFSFIINLIFAGRFLKRIKLENAHSTNINKIVKQYGLLIQKIEQEPFTSKKLTDLQNLLLSNNQKASVALNQLSELFAKLDALGNMVMTVILNGTVLYHVHNLKDIINWKKNNHQNLEKWLHLIGEIEMLNSLANFKYNNPEFVFPTLNNNREIAFESLSHPLLNPKTRIGNDISFQPQSFVILTGSNMSGKSTFLRSLGINMVLAGMGSPVCAAKANIHPMKILVSMRLSDSLSDSESYFYAEIKRLKQIMNELDNKPGFVLLDEILRGTNSDDKRSGTIEVIKKMLAKNAIGAIATHDIEVCLTTNEFPTQLINKCFEVAIVNNDLHFDFKLQDGICKNKSATFLMTKMGVI